MPKSKRLKQNIACTYDFVYVDNTIVILSKDNKLDKTNVILMNGFNNNTFTEMGKNGYLRGRAKVFYEKGKELFPKHKIKEFKSDHIPKNTEIYYDF